MVFGKLFAGLKKTRDKLQSGFGRLFSVRRELDEALLDEIEEVLYGADLGPIGSELVDSLKTAYKRREVKTTDDVVPFFRAELKGRLEGAEGELRRAPRGPTVILVVGVNGSGKTTSIAKLARHLSRDGASVLLGAGDTFRAAAVAYDAVAAAVARDVDYLILDTAGRLHTQKNLMQELGKIRRVVSKQIPDAPHETLLVLDATTGQNAIRQAEEFTSIAAVTGLILAKMDGTAKGGAVLGIRRRLPLPVLFLGVGEGIDDLERFDVEAFLDAILVFERQGSEAG